mmetsp:Transcript_17503/g.52622  ORF Transcript_17503/g.52622 Transcript_17503/m.52622 type:complete len:322 (-) Transcript_17503:300-1265(-)
MCRRTPWGGPKRQEMCLGVDLRFLPKGGQKPWELLVGCCGITSSDLHCTRAVRGRIWPVQGRFEFGPASLGGLPLLFAGRLDGHGLDHVAGEVVAALDALALHVNLDNVAVITQVDKLFKLVLHAVAVEDVKWATGHVDVDKQCVKLLADLKAADLVIDADGLCTTHRGQVQALLERDHVHLHVGRDLEASCALVVEATLDRKLVRAQAACVDDRHADRREHRGGDAARDVGAQPNLEPQVHGVVHPEAGVSQEEVAERAVADRRAALHQQPDRVVVQQRTVRHQRLVGQQPRLVKHERIAAVFRVQVAREADLPAAFADV